MGYRRGYASHNATGATASLDHVTITHPHHPFTGKGLKFLGLHGSSVKLKGPDGRTLRIPIDWTDFEKSETETVQTEITHLLSIEGLRELVRFFNARERQCELNVPRSSNRKTFSL